MIKRRFYRLEHGERDSGSDSSSFSSDSEVETEDSEESEDDVAVEISEDGPLSERNEEDEPSSVSPGPLTAYNHSDNDNTDVGVDDDADSDGVGDDDNDDDDDEHGERMQKTKLSSTLGVEVSDAKFDTVDEKELAQDIPDCIIRCKSVFKCRVCPNVICLNESTMRAHVLSKRHARSERLLKQGKSEVIDSDGEVDNHENTERASALNTASEKQQRGSKRSRRQRKRPQRNEQESNKEGENVEAVPHPKRKRPPTKD